MAVFRIASEVWRQMLNLCQVGIWIAVIDQRVQKFGRLPDALSPLFRPKILLLFGYDIVERLIDGSAGRTPQHLEWPFVILTKLGYRSSLPGSGRLENHPIRQYLSGAYWMVRHV